MFVFKHDQTANVKRIPSGKDLEAGGLVASGSI